MPAKLYIIDGHALIFRMYYAFARHPMINSKGADMSILFGFTKYLMELIEKRRPDGLAVAFDPPGGTFRNELYPAYKANRTETPQLVIDALEPLKELCGALNIPVLMVPGFEADDVIGTVAKRFASADNQVIMVTPDKDYGQLIEDNILQLKPGKGAADDELFGPAEVCAKYGIQTPSQVIEMLTLCGDASDNVPGVKGVGEVGAAKLIGLYGSVKNIYANLDKLSERQQAMFREAEGHIALSHELVTIKTDVPVEVTAADLAFTGKYQPLAADLFGKYEFGSLRKYLSGHVDGGGAGQVPFGPEKRADGPQGTSHSPAGGDKAGESSPKAIGCTIWPEGSVPGLGKAIALGWSNGDGLYLVRFTFAKKNNKFCTPARFLRPGPDGSVETNVEKYMGNDDQYLWHLTGGSEASIILEAPDDREICISAMVVWDYREATFYNP